MSNAIKIGDLTIDSFKVGAADCSIFLGNEKLYPEEPTFEGKYMLTLSDSSTVSAECDGTSAITSGEVSSQYSGTVVSAEIGDCVTEIGVSAFKGCNSLSSIDIPNSVTTIGNIAFYNCSSLTSVTIPNAVTSISNSAFKGCNSLSSIDIPNSVTTIDNAAFSGCTSLASIDLPDSVTSIGFGAFRSCSSLTSIDIPSGVTSIGGGAFNGCSGLASITVNATTPPTLGSNAFGGSTCPIYVPAESLEAYKEAWSTYASRIQAIV